MHKSQLQYLAHGLYKMKFDAGLKEIILCSQNEKDVEEIESEFIKGIKFHFVKTMSQVLELALVHS